MTTLDIHFEGHTETLTLRKLLLDIVPFNVSFTPYDFIDYEGRGPRHSQTIIELIKDGVRSKLITLGQQGHKHKCKYLHKIADPWHENFCFYNEPLSLEEQIGLMNDGKEILENTFNVEPLIYIPPNHMYDKTTLEAAKILGYKYFADLALLKLNPYEENGIIIVPESEINSRETDIVYLHYDEIEKYDIFWKIFTADLKPLTKIKDLPESQLSISINTKLKNTKKRLRDIRNLSKSI